jgi:hypothetical protein
MAEPLAGPSTAGRKKESVARGRVEFKAPPERVGRATREGARLGPNLSAFIRTVVTRSTDRAQAERGAQAPPARGKKGGGA